MPAVPVMPRFVKVATPEDTVRVVVPTSVPPAEIVAVATDVESEVTVLPSASRIAICGCVVKAAPDAVPTDAREITMEVAAPAVGVIDCVVEVSEPEEKVTVYAVPAVPELPRFVNVATPLTAVAVVVPINVAPVETAAVTTELESLVSVFPDES